MAEEKTKELTFEEGGEEKTVDIAEDLTDSLADVAGGMGRHLGVFSCTMLMYVLSYTTPAHCQRPHFSVGRIIGTGIFSTPSSILLSSVNSVGATLMLWVLGFVLSFCGLFIWLEFGTMIPRSGGEKVYLEAVYKKPKFLATIIFATNAILLGFTAAGCIVSSCRSLRGNLT